MKRPVAVHPPLFALHPVLALYAANVSLIPWRDALWPAALCVGGASVVWALLARLLRDAGRAAAAVSVGVWITFTFDLWRPLIQRVAGETASSPVTSLELAAWAVITLCAMAVLGWKHRANGTVTGFLNVMGGGLCVLALASALGTHAAIRRGLARYPAPVAASRVREGTPRPPDIFHIILDGYGRTDVFQRQYGFSDQAFVDALRRRGFLVDDDARSNYVQTELSLASMLNMEPIQAMVEPQGARSRERAVLDAIIERNGVASALRGRGYKYIALTTGFPALEFATADVVLGNDVGESLFTSALVSKTPFRPGVGAVQSQFESRRRMLAGAFENLRRLAVPGSSPRFVLAHVLAPHPPFVFGPNGEPRRPSGGFGIEDGTHYLQMGKSRESYVAGYREQARHIANLTLEAIDALLAQPGSRPIIVLHGDHGPKAHLDQDSLKGTDVNECFPILLAVLAPKAVTDRLAGHHTLVNVYGAVLSGVFGESLPPEPDRSYYSAWPTPLELTDVTGQIRPRLRPAPGE